MVLWAVIILLTLLWLKALKDLAKCQERLLEAARIILQHKLVAEEEGWKDV